jgi:hypothetical protein
MYADSINNYTAVRIYCAYRQLCDHVGGCVMAGLTWTFERHEQLCALFHAGLSFGAIAERMGSTRGTIAGRVRRYGLSRDARGADSPKAEQDHEEQTDAADAAPDEKPTPDALDELLAAEAAAEQGKDEPADNALAIRPSVCEQIQKLAGDPYCKSPLRLQRFKLAVIDAGRHWGVREVT